MAEEKKLDKEEMKNQEKEETTINAQTQEEPCETEQGCGGQELEFVPMDEYVKLKYQLSDFVNRYKAYEHEFENYKKRTKEEIKNAKDEGIIKALETILPALDAFKKARKIITDKSSISGIALIEKNIFTQLEKLGVKKIECENKEFNTDFHNAVMLVEDEDKEPGTIVEEVEAGYTLNDKVIKYSQVIVSK